MLPSIHIFVVDISATVINDGGGGDGGNKKGVSMDINREKILDER